MKLIFYSFISLCRGFIFSGATAPLGFWDPLELSKSVDIGHLAFLREAELKHSRWSMVSLLTMPVIECKTRHPSINEFNELTTELKIIILILIGYGEFNTMIRGWENPFNIGDYSLYSNTKFYNASKMFKLVTNYQPGDIGLGVIETFDYIEHDTINNLELNHGRLAMITSIIVIILEYVYKVPLFASANIDLM
tara:strand:- start:12752 stop:13333 length:582 start_codon:yes stop_codon:yes gene_type:complete